MLSTSTQRAFGNGLPISELPQTFKDAIKVAHFLGVLNLWIDAVCSFQGSPQDWEYETKMMSAVYSNAYCVIAAAASTEPNDSLFRKRNPEHSAGACGSQHQAGRYPHTRFFPPYHT